MAAEPDSGLDRVWHDLQVLGLDLSLDTSPPVIACLQPGTTGGLLIVAGRPLGLIGASPAWPARDQASRLADQTQDLVNEGLGPEGVTWPQCPQHPHPMVVSSADDSGWWTCPGDPSIRVAIGQLASRASQ